MLICKTLEWKVGIISFSHDCRSDATERAGFNDSSPELGGGWVSSSPPSSRTASSLLSAAVSSVDQRRNWAMRLWQTTGISFFFFFFGGWFYICIAYWTCLTLSDIFFLPVSFILPIFYIGEVLSEKVSPGQDFLSHTWMLSSEQTFLLERFPAGCFLPQQATDWFYETRQWQPITQSKMV